MAGPRQTQDGSDDGGSGARGQEAASSLSGSGPGLLVAFHDGQPAAAVIPLIGGRAEVGRDDAVFGERIDPRMSRQHIAVTCPQDHGQGRRFLVTDLGSRNGTLIDGTRIPAGEPHAATRIIRVGDTLLLPVRELGPLARFGVRQRGERVEGPALQAVLGAVERAGRLDSTLHITGESGSGKEGLARAFHESGPASAGRFVPVNCAAIPEGLAERLLFGVRRGAYSGADADADGYIQASTGGTLFLDEVAELSLAVQAKLLRVLETGEVLSLGATRAREVNLRVCSATHRDLRAQVAAGKLREDLYFRIAQPRVVVPPLRERPEEIPWLIAAVLAGAARELLLHVSFVEECLLRPWPGNVRELCAETRNAATAALVSGCTRVDSRHLGATAGQPFSPTTPPPEPPPTPAVADSPAPPPSRAKLRGALKRTGGSISAAARLLGVHRTQLRRFLERHGIDARDYAQGPVRAQESPDKDES